ncbi:transmembrane protein 129-like [Halichondria panicea]|uniref:transmembrane protein 129-like n=1 Tax=Halichondria panicea TaxID=6063 RepID=UPI00312B2C6A
METSAVLYTAAFIAYGLMDVLGLMPQEISSAGLTLPGLFSKYFGDPSLDFTRYHLRRTTCSVIVHLFLPLVYCIGLSFVCPSLHMFNPRLWSATTLSIWLPSVTVGMIGLSIALYWYTNNWQRHPMTVQLSQLGQPWRRVAGSINAEFLHIDKFVSQLGGSTVIVTDSWIIQCNVHSVNLIHQRDAVLNVAAADEHNFTLDGQSKQYLTINVNSINSKFKSFSIRLNSHQYSQLTDKLQAPIRTARTVLIQQSLSDRFISAFREQVQRNGMYQIPPGSPALEPCVGCLQVLPQVKIQKMCAPVDDGQCRQCFCRPMWCLSCMSKWFAARQDKDRPDSWMSSTAPCPMCRAKFCMLDVFELSL